MSTTSTVREPDLMSTKLAAPEVHQTGGSRRCWGCHHGSLKDWYTLLKSQPSCPVDTDESDNAVASDSDPDVPAAAAAVAPPSAGAPGAAGGEPTWSAVPPAPPPGPAASPADLASHLAKYGDCCDITAEQVALHYGCELIEHLYGLHIITAC